LAINLFTPGQYLPMHSDLFGKYKKIHNVQEKNIERYILMLQNNKPGQILQIENKSYSDWESGDCFGWKYNQPHAFYNFSMENRYAVQITGVVK
jgi:hypothetical protein